jgi:hypothetical protein
MNSIPIDFNLFFTDSKMENNRDFWVGDKALEKHFRNEKVQNFWEGESYWESLKTFSLFYFTFTIAADITPNGRPC